MIWELNWSVLRICKILTVVKTCAKQDFILQKSPLLFKSGEFQPYHRIFSKLIGFLPKIILFRCKKQGANSFVPGSKYLDKAMWENPVLNILHKRIKSSERICEPWSPTVIHTEIVVSVFLVILALGHSWSSSSTKFIDTWKSPTIWFLCNDDKTSYKHEGISVDCQALTFPAVGLHTPRRNINRLGQLRFIQSFWLH